MGRLFDRLVWFALIWLKVGFLRAASIYFSIGVVVVAVFDLPTAFLGNRGLLGPGWGRTGFLIGPRFGLLIALLILPWTLMYGFYPGAAGRAARNIGRAFPRRWREMHLVVKICFVLAAFFPLIPITLFSLNQIVHPNETLAHEIKITYLNTPMVRDHIAFYPRFVRALYFEATTPHSKQHPLPKTDDDRFFESLDKKFDPAPQNWAGLSQLHSVLAFLVTTPLLLSLAFIGTGLALNPRIKRKVRPIPSPLPHGALPDRFAPAAATSPRLASVVWRFTCDDCSHSFAVEAQTVPPRLGCPHCGAPVRTQTKRR